MIKRPAKPTADAAPGLNIPERILLFCVASDTDWEHAGITGTTVDDRERSHSARLETHRLNNLRQPELASEDSESAAHNG